MKRNWYSVELQKNIANEFKLYLRDKGIKYEPSEAYNLIHFQCFMTEKELYFANQWLRGLS